MPAASQPDNEPQRLDSVHALHLLDTLPEERFDRLVRIAQRLFAVPVALVSLIDSERQWVKAQVGLKVNAFPRPISFCSHTILQVEPLIAEDMRLDRRFADNPLVTGAPFFRFYAGLPLRGPSGLPVGTLCLLDYQTRAWGQDDLVALRDLGAIVENELGSLEFNRTLTLLRESEERFRRLTEATFEGVALIEGGVIVDANGAFARMFGYEPSSVIGMKVEDFVSSQVRSRVLYSVRTNDERPYETTGLRLDGTTFPIEVSGRAVPYHGKRVRVTTIRDISRLKRNEADLRRHYREAERARSESRAILDAVGEAIILVGPNAHFLDVNQRFTEFFGIGADEVLGRSFYDFEAQIERIFTAPDHFRAQIMGTSSDSESEFTTIISQKWPVARELELCSSPVHSVGGDFVGRLYVFRDVTSEREVERLKSDFFARVSHELRTPLTAIKGYVDLLAEGEAGDLNEEQGEFLDIVASNASRLLTMINALLDIARLEAGKIVLKRRPLDVGKLLQQQAARFDADLSAKAQQLTLELPDSLPPVLADPERLPQVVNNLLSNATRYTPAGGQITLSASAQGNVVRIAVRDTGVGMSVEEQAQSFTPFFRAQSAPSQDGGGGGMGLAIARALVDLHGGQLELTSAPGEGSTFAFTLPIAVGDAPVPVGTGSLTRAAPGRRILVVEDEESIASLLQRYMERGGYEVRIVPHGQTVLDHAKQWRPDLITLELLLADTDGFTVLEQLKSDAATASIPVLVISSLPDSGWSTRLGAVDHLVKPINPLVLVEQLHRILDRQQWTILLAGSTSEGWQLLGRQLESAGYRVLLAADGLSTVTLAQSQHPDLALLPLQLAGVAGLATLRSLRADPATRHLPIIIASRQPLSPQERAAIAALGVKRHLVEPFSEAEAIQAIRAELARPEEEEEIE